MEREKPPTLAEFHERIMFEPVGEVQRFAKFEGSDGYTYLMETIVRGDTRNTDDLEAEGWRFIESVVPTVHHSVEGEQHARKYPGPIMIAMWRRPRLEH